MSEVIDLFVTKAKEKMAKAITETKEAAANDPGSAIEKLDEKMTKLGEELEESLDTLLETLGESTRPMIATKIAGLLPTALAPLAGPFTSLISGAVIRLSKRLFARKPRKKVDIAKIFEGKDKLATLHKQIVDAARVAREFADPRWSTIETRDYWQKSVIDIQATGSFDERRRNLNRWQPKATAAEIELKTFGAHKLFQTTRDNLLKTILTNTDLSPFEKKQIIDYWGYDANEVPNYVLTTGQQNTLHQLIDGVSRDVWKKLNPSQAEEAPTSRKAPALEAAKRFSEVATIKETKETKEPKAAVTAKQKTNDVLIKLGEELFDGLKKQSELWKRWFPDIDTDQTHDAATPRNLLAPAKREKYDILL